MKDADLFSSYGFSRPKVARGLPVDAQLNALDLHLYRGLQQF